MRSGHLLAALSACYCCTLAVADDPDPRKMLDEARTLARQGKYEEALEKHIWFHVDALKHQPSMRGVRLSYALADWVELGHKYPKAKEALVSIRDDDIKALGEGRGPSDLFQDVAAINHYLKEEPKTVELFKTLHENHPGLAERCYAFAEKDLAARREYAICSGYIPDAIRRFDRIRERRERNLELGVIKGSAERSFVEETCRLIEILVGAGREKDAESVREQALSVRDDRQFRDAIEKAGSTDMPGR